MRTHVYITKKLADFILVEHSTDPSGDFPFNAEFDAEKDQDKEPVITQSAVHKSINLDEHCIYLGPLE